MHGRAHTGRLQDFSEVEKARGGCGRVAPLLLMQLGGMKLRNRTNAFLMYIY